MVDAIAHIHASFNNTIITITDRQGNACPGRRQVAAVSAVRASRHRLLPRLRPRKPAALRSTSGSRTWTCAFVDRARAASLRYAR